MAKKNLGFEDLKLQDNKPKKQEKIDTSSVKVTGIQEQKDKKPEEVKDDTVTETNTDVETTEQKPSNDIEESVPETNKGDKSDSETEETDTVEEITETGQNSTEDEGNEETDEVPALLDMFMNREVDGIVNPGRVNSLVIAVANCARFGLDKEVSKAFISYVKKGEDKGIISSSYAATVPEEIGDLFRDIVRILQHPNTDVIKELTTLKAHKEFIALCM